MQERNALLSLEALVTEVRVLRLKAVPLRIGLVNGCFDLLHPGHVAFIAEAATHCDRLIVAVDSDERVHILKGPGRPIRPLADRAAVVGALRDVWAVVAIEVGEGGLTTILRDVRPDVYIHRADPPAVEAVYASDLLGIETVDLGRHGDWSTSEELGRIHDIKDAIMGKAPASV